MKVLITGATGFIGRHLVPALQKQGHQLLILSRHPEKAPELYTSVDTLGWDFNSALPAFPACDAVINLAGESILAKRWTDEIKQRLGSSRVDATRLLVGAAKQSPTPPKIWINASAVGYYGDRGDEALDESSGAGDDFLANLCIQWENAARGAKEFGARVVLARLGVVLGADGGALEQMLGIFHRGLGGRLGTGQQWMSWVHIDDVVGMFSQALVDERWRDAVNFSAPNPVRNEEFTKTLGKVLDVTTHFAAPAFALKTILGERATVALSSQQLLPKKAEGWGYKFHHEHLGPALASLVARS